MHRPLALLIAVVDVTALALLGQARLAAILGIFMIFLIACIWFPQAMGDYTFPVWKRASPAAWVQGMAWVLLAGISGFTLFIIFKGG